MRISTTIKAYAVIVCGSQANSSLNVIEIKIFYKNLQWYVLWTLMWEQNREELEITNKPFSNREETSFSDLIKQDSFQIKEKQFGIISKKYVK